jgi:hypothetical protein
MNESGRESFIFTFVRIYPPICAREEVRENIYDRRPTDTKRSSPGLLH